jgi:hypothetical protein
MRGKNKEYCKNVIMKERPYVLKLVEGGIHINYYKENPIPKTPNTFKVEQPKFYRTYEEWFLDNINLFETRGGYNGRFSYTEIVLPNKGKLHIKTS